MRIFGAILTGVVLSLTTIGILFKFQSWPMATFFLTIGLIGILVSFIVGVIKHSKTKSEYYTRILKRITIIGGLGLILLILPKETWLEIKYRNQPDYVDAVKKAMADPDNEELWEKVDEEQEKMNKK
jgi:NADH:ubiquinone oxidoreductase subunit 6 (subunit J)